MVKRVPQKYAASDGREFETEPEAKKHEALHTAKQAYETARALYAKHLWESQQTADGEPFDLSRTTPYYQVIDWLGWPHIEEVRFWPHSCYLNDNNQACIQAEHRDGMQTHWVSYRIATLYANERAAKVALLKALELALVERRNEVRALRARLKD